MNVAEFLSDLKRADIHVRAEGGRLKLNAPEGALTEELKLQIQTHKPLILEFLTAARREANESIPRVDHTGGVELSYAQARLWFLAQLASGGAYNIPAAFRVEGPLEEAVLQEALRTVVRQQASLRTVFRSADPGHLALQLVLPECEPGFESQDLRGHAPTDRDARVAKTLSRENTWSFDLSAGPLLRVTLLRLADDEWLLILNLHHLIADAWSLEILLRDLDRARLPAAQLPEPPSTYPDYAVWQRARPSEASREYWRE